MHSATKRSRRIITAGLAAVAAVATVATLGIAGTAQADTGDSSPWTWAYSTPYASIYDQQTMGDLRGETYNEFNDRVSPQSGDRSTVVSGSAADMTSQTRVLRSDFAIPIARSVMEKELAPDGQKWPETGVLPNIISNVNPGSVIITDATWHTVPDASRIYKVNLLSLPGATEWGLTGEYFVPGADATTGTLTGWHTGPADAGNTATVLSGHDGQLRFQDVTTTPAPDLGANQFWGPSLMIWAQTNRGYAVQLLVGTMFDATIQAQPAAADHAFEIVEGDRVIVDAAAMRDGAAWSDGPIGELLPVVDAALPANASLAGTTLTVAGVKAGDEQTIGYSLAYTQPQSAGVIASPAARMRFVTVPSETSPPVEVPPEEGPADPTPTDPTPAPKSPATPTTPAVTPAPTAPTAKFPIVAG